LGLHCVPLDNPLGIVHRTLLLDIRGEHAGANCQMVCLVNQSLVGVVHLLAHHNVAKFVINFGVESGISDEIYNPNLSLILRHVEPLCEHVDRHTLMNTTEGLKDRKARILPEVVKAGSQEKVVHEDHLALPQLPLGAVKVVVDVEALNELGDGIRVLIRLLLDNLDKVWSDLIALTFVADHCRCQISENVRAHCLNGIQIRRLEQKVVNNDITSLNVIEEDVQTPMDEPGALLQSLQRIAEVVIVNIILELIEVVETQHPFLTEDIRGQLPPKIIEIVLIRGCDKKTMQN